MTRMSDDRIWMAAGALPGLILIGYLITHSVGIPGFTGDVGEWAEPPALAAMIAEATLVTLSAGVLDEPAAAMAATSTAAPGARRDHGAAPGGLAAHPAAGAGAGARPSSPPSGITRSSQRGSHQLRSPSSCITAGTSTIRTTVASTRTAVASPTPISFSDTSELSAKRAEHRDHDQRGGRDHPRGAGEPRRTARDVSRRARYSSRTRESRNTS